MYDGYSSYGVSIQSQNPAALQKFGGGVDGGEGGSDGGGRGGGGEGGSDGGGRGGGSCGGEGGGGGDKY